MRRARTRVLCVFLFVAASIGVPHSAHAVCPPDAQTLAGWTALRAANWRMEGAPGEPDALVLALAGCLANPDPHLRDELAFEGMQSLMRGGSLQPVTLETLRTRLVVQLRDDDPDGVARPFAALALAEVVRADRVSAFMTPVERADLLARGADYLRNVRDYRGFDPHSGWRHGVAHGSDLMLQFALNPALQPGQYATILDAVGSQVAPPDHDYVHGEPARLARAVFYLAQRPDFTAADWERWLLGLVPPTQAQFSLRTLTVRHNLTEFLGALYIDASEDEDAAQRTKLLPAVRKALEALG